MQLEEPTRSPAQNDALHLYFDWCAKALNDAGLTVQATLKPGIELEWTPALFKEIVWRGIQRWLLNKESTTELARHGEIDLIVEHVTRMLARHGIEGIPFPSTESAMEEGVHIRE